MGLPTWDSRYDEMMSNLATCNSYFNFYLFNESRNLFPGLCLQDIQESFIALQAINPEFITDYLELLTQG